MENDEFKRVGEDLFGQGWQTRLARALGVDGSTVRRWVGSAVPVPPQIAAFLDLLGSRQEARGALVFAMQGLSQPLAVSVPDPVRLEWMRRRLQFPGVDNPKPMPAIHASETDGTITLSLTGEPQDAVGTGTASFTMTRHPDSRHLEGYLDAATARGHAPVVASHRFHHYTVIAHDDGGDPATTWQISTHAGLLRTVGAPVGTDGMTGWCTLATLPGGDPLGED
jgi:hypothetical protein